MSQDIYAAHYLTLFISFKICSFEFLWVKVDDVSKKKSRIVPLFSISSVLVDSYVCFH